jgi:transcription antitermination factor NusG
MQLGQSNSWYALRVKSNRERITAEALKGKGFPVCLPCYSDRSRRPNSTQTVELPLFPGYVFCCFDVTRRLPILTVPGVVHIVSCGRIPQPVEEREMAAVLSVIRSGLPARPHQLLPIGQRIELVRGPLAGAQGVILSYTGGEEFVVSVSLLQRSIAVKVDRNWINPDSLNPATPQPTGACASV